MSFEVAGKTALVTGANRGIGKAIVVSLLEHGASKVYAAVRTLESAAPLVEAHGEKVVPIHLDLSQPESITRAAEAAKDVELVVSNAGVLKNATPMADDAIEMLQFEMEINVYGLIRMAQAFAPALKANGGGAFVQLNSVASLKCFTPFTTYSASKAASYTVTQGLRDLLAEQGTQVLSVHPGPIASDMADSAGLTEVAEPPSLVGDGIVQALADGQFHLFPDTMARNFGEAYQNFAEAIINADVGEG